MKISYVCGICVKNDAISNAIHNEITWLNTGSADVRLFAYSCDYNELPFTRVHELRDVVFDQHFQTSDLIIFHFGIFCPLFNTLFVCPQTAKRLVIFHNITPKQFIPPDSHEIIDKSFKQMANIMFADHVVCDSKVNLQVLNKAGIYTPATTLPLAVHGNLKAPEQKPSAVDGRVRLVFIGRFVYSKGPHELLEAVSQVLQRSKSIKFNLDLIGNLSFSDSELIARMRVIIQEIKQDFGGRAEISIHGSASNEKKNKILQAADLFVLPTYHEGFCVPILEALANGCKVITYENSNTPFISGGFAKLIPTGNIADLSCAILDTANLICSAEWSRNDGGLYHNYIEKVHGYIQHFSPDRAKHRFLKLINNLMTFST